jgi:hypothetical protein
MITSPRPASARGAYASSRTWSAGCDGRGDVDKTSDVAADGEIVWSWRPDAGAKFLRSKLLRGDGGKKPGSPGRSRISRKTIAQGRPDVSGPACGSCRVLFCCTRAMGASSAPGLPCALCCSGGLRTTRARQRAETADACPAGFAEARA